jgi:hypothetical protein
MPSRITQSEVTVRSGPSLAFYPTSRLYLGESVRVVREEASGWLAIVPPPGSFSWIKTSLVEQIGANAVVVSAPEGQIWVGSRLINSKPTVWRTKVAQGTQLTMIGRAEAAQDGTWLPILPAPAEVRYIPAEAVEARATSRQTAAPLPEPIHPATTPAGFASPQQTDKGAVPPSFGAGAEKTPAPPPSHVSGSVVQPGVSSTASSLQLQAEDAERAGNLAAAKDLWQELADQVQSTDHALWVRCHNRLQALQDRMQSGTSGTDSPPGSALPLQQQPRAPSEYCYLRDSGYTARLSAPVVSGLNPPSANEQWYEPGRLRRTAFSLDNRRLYCLQPLHANQRHIYVAAGADVDLEPYVEKNVYLCGPVVYRGDLRTYYMTVVRVSPAR